MVVETVWIYVVGVGCLVWWPEGGSNGGHDGIRWGPSG